MALALTMLRALYSTQLGIRVIDLIPDGFWNLYHRMFGIGAGDLEVIQDADALMIFLMCLFTTGGALLVGTSLLGRAFAIVRRVLGPSQDRPS
jgi:hypothetical protein